MGTRPWHSSPSWSPLSKGYPTSVFWAWTGFSEKQATLFIISTTKQKGCLPPLNEFAAALLKTGTCRWYNCQHWGEAACRLLCYHQPSKTSAAGDVHSPIQAWKPNCSWGTGQQSTGSHLDSLTALGTTNCSMDNGLLSGSLWPPAECRAGLLPRQHWIVKRFLSKLGAFCHPHPMIFHSIYTLHQEGRCWALGSDVHTQAVPLRQTSSHLLLILTPTISIPTEPGTGSSRHAPWHSTQQSALGT